MVTFEVNDMTCGHCVSAITKAVAFVDPGAKVDVDLAAHRVEIEPVASTAPVLGDAIETAGFTPVYLATAFQPASKEATSTGGSCCCR